MKKKNTILVNATDAALRRNRAPAELKVEVLANNVNLFLSQIESVLEKTPENVGKFKFTEFVVSAEISAKGGLVLMGTGVEATVGGGLTFKFERKA